MKKLVAVLLLLVLFVGAKQSLVSSKQKQVIPIGEDIMHVDSLNRSVTKLEESVEKLNKLVK